MVSASARPAITLLRGIGSERSRSMKPGFEVLGDTRRRARPGEQHARDDEAGHEEVDVGDTLPVLIAPPNT